MASLWTNKGLFLAVTGALDLDTHVFKGMLVKNSFTPNQDDNFASTPAAAECDVAGYTGGFGGAGRKTLGSPTVTEDDSANRIKFDATDPSTWAGLAAGNTLRTMAVIREVTNDADSPVVLYNDMGADKITNGGDFSAAIHADGLGYIAT